MPDSSAPVSASRFAISIDGCEVGSFATLIASTSPEGEARSVQPHELAHVMQQRSSYRRLKWPPLELKRAVLDQTALKRMQVPGSLPGVFVQHVDSAGRRSPQVAMPRVTFVESSSPVPKGTGQVALDMLFLATDV